MNRDYQCITHPLLNQDMWVFPHEKLDTIRDIMQAFIQSQRKKHDLISDYGLLVQDAKSGKSTRIDCMAEDISDISEELLRSYSSGRVFFISVYPHLHSFVINMELLNGRLQARPLYFKSK